MAENTGKIYEWALRRTESQNAPFWMGVIFVLEIILIIPLDAILVFFCLQNRLRIPLYVLVAALSSMVSGLIGYLLGHGLWDLIGPYVVPYLISASSFDHFAQHYQHYETWAVLIGSFLPIPLKLISLSAGVFHLGIVSFAFSLFLARLLRFGLVGTAMYLFGARVKAFVDRHFRGLFFLVGAKIALGFAFFYAMTL